MAHPHPPRLARFLLRALLPVNQREFVVGDLDEEFRSFVRPRFGWTQAALWYWSHAARSAWYGRLGNRPRRLTRAPAPAPALRGKRMGTLSTGLQDIRFTFRNMRRAPGFVILALLTLGLGIGATTAIFSAVNEVLLRPLGFAEPDRLVMLWESNVERGWEDVHAAPANVLDWRERVSGFADVAMINEFTFGMAVTREEGAVQATVGHVSGNTFDVIGVQPVLGRGFRFDETWEDSDPVVILSHGAWVRYFGADSSVVGSVVPLDGADYRVVGLMAEGFRYAFNDAEMWVTFRWTEARRQSIWFRQAHVVRAVARLQPGVTHDQARTELAAVAAQLREEYPRLNRLMDAGFTPLHRFLVGDNRLPLMLLLGAVGLLMLIASANVANLMLVRSVARRQEMAVRTALGASRARIVRQVLTECLLLGIGGTVAGVALGFFALRWLAALAPPGLPELAFRPDHRVLAFTIAVTGLSTLLFGIAPALRSSNLDVRDALGDGSRLGSIGRRSLRAANLIVTCEIALALMIVTGAGLLYRSLDRMRSVEMGVDPQNVLTFQVRPPSGTYPTDRAKADFAFRLVERLEGIPGVVGAGIVRGLPLTGSGWTSDFSIEGWGPDEFGVEVRHREATPGYFSAMGIPLLAGEIFRASLAPGQPVPVLVNRALAERYFPDNSPVGKRISFDRRPSERSYWYTIVGVVGNERRTIAAEPGPEIIAHLRGDTPHTMLVVMKTSVDALDAAPSARAALAELDPGIPLVALQTMDQVAADTRARDRFLVALFAVFAIVALGLASVGVYGVAAQVSRARVRDIGIRLALGASHQDIIRALLARASISAAAGVILGIAGAAGASRFMRGVLYGVEPFDPLTFTLVAGFLAAVAMVSSYIPARRASRVDPLQVLRTD